MTKHKTVYVKVGMFEAEIDEEIAPLIEEIWKADMGTTNSCQENQSGIAWIGFTTSFEAAEFLDIVAGEYSAEFDSLYNRIRGKWDSTSDPVQGMWQYSLYPVDVSVRQWDVDENTIDEEAIGSREFIFHVSIRFPRTDIDVLLQRMREFNLVGNSAG